MRAKDLIMYGTFAYKIHTGIVCVFTVLGFEEKGDRYNEDTYTGTQTIICPNRESIVEEWSCSADVLEREIISGKYIRIG